MSNFFRDLSGQGASSSRDNTQWWVDKYQDPAAKKRIDDIKAKQAAGTPLSTPEQNELDMYNHFTAKALKEGVEPSKSVSASTGVPDLTDSAAQSRKMTEALSLVSGRGRRASMANGQYDDSMLGGF